MILSTRICSTERNSCAEADKTNAATWVTVYSYKSVILWGSSLCLTPGNCRSQLISAWPGTNKWLKIIVFCELKPCICTVACLALYMPYPS
jgi:dissimilatory sulfite reductase (desulfoviridin) alpha/beta subunit